MKTWLLLLLFTALRLGAQTAVFSTSTDANSDVGITNIIAGGGGSSIRNAYQFSAGAGDYTLHSINVSVSVNFPADAVLQFLLEIYADAGDQPDTLLQTLTSPVSFADWPSPGSTATVFTASSSLTLLSGQNYWLSFTPTGLGSISNLLHWAVDDENTPTFGLNSYAVSPDGPAVWGAWTSSQTDELPVFTVYATPVPEPATYALLGGLAALALAGFRRRQAG